MDAPWSRRAFLAGSALSLSALAGCAGVSAPLSGSAPSAGSDTDRNGNGCADIDESFTVRNRHAEEVTIRVVVVHDDGEAAGGTTVFDHVFRVPASEARIAREPVFTTGSGTYRIEATYEQHQARRIIEGVPCYTRQNRIVSVALDQYESLGVDVEWA